MLGKALWGIEGSEGEVVKPGVWLVYMPGGPKVAAIVARLRRRRFLNCQTITVIRIANASRPTHRTQEVVMFEVVCGGADGGLAPGGPTGAIVWASAAEAASRSTNRNCGILRNHLIELQM
jgi:hypothetical protein